MRENFFKPFLLLILLLVAVISRVLAQDFTVTGIVKDETGAVVPGATILVKGTTVGTATDASGA
ncbi:carboxypeptidase-like regulatory domain-containing protein [Dyadobacter sp. CY312]|uniref:carboxypeptidase-like regulatory domain-containing protein n=1 Tax=Dyadobacter sp. CY312 TaxID=2907303 RepID=UPI001F2EEBED|nr:carboxypeptidase-like regulatory domain-containing protein [Dyadobacter sp. CY312]MCE7044107.1 carboxypeptidase-like regulatory domain-containing protein [Dyadobacter sp. CY312]